MKKLSFVLLSLIALTTACSTSDDTNYVPVVSSFEVSDLITIPEASETYNVDDTLFVELNIPVSLVADDGTPIKLDSLVPDARFSEIFLFRYEEDDIERKSPIPFTNTDVFVSEGQGRLAAEGVVLTAIKEEDTYKLRAGIKLKTAGSYFLAPYNQSTTDSFYAILQDSRTLDIVELKTTIAGQTPSNRFSYEVVSQ